ncbi:MAG: Zn-dependent alcohol dehydrogenase [Candidatus Poribacteria bacterium]|nr:MAG: Zn-dependent alcohol dehydrogenase [Candidatus Poribacteria bacterium]
MKAVVKYGLGDREVELREVPEPGAPGPGEVILEVRAAGVCGSDVEFWRSKIDYPINVPVILGHEFCGVVHAVGEGVEGFQTGDRVVSETAAVVCGVCEFCRSGEYNVCPERLGFGYGVDGAFTRYVRVPVRCLHRIPEGVPFEHAALTEPIAVGYNALCVKSTVLPGDWVVVLGPGPIGLFAAQVAKIAGARVVVVGLSVDRKRLAVAEQIGFDAVLNAERHSVARYIAERTRGRGADLVVDAAGANAAFATAMEIVRRNGQITKIAWNRNPLNLSLDPIVAKAVRVQGSYSHTWRTWEHVLELLAKGAVQIEPMITHRMPLTQWERAFEAAEEREAVKAILYPVS